MQAIARGVASATTASFRVVRNPERFDSVRQISVSAYRLTPTPADLSLSSHLTPTALVTTMTRRDGLIPSSPFPLHGLLPKEEIQAASWLKRFPEWDGRNVRVAVLDTGVDPAAFGLDGEGKVVDIIDCTGGGDIPMKEVEPLAGDSLPKDAASDAVYLPGLCGRTLLASSSWINPTSKWRVGYKPAFELFPDDLVARRRRERKDQWDVDIGKLLSKAKEDLNAYEKATKQSNEKELEEKSSSATKSNDDTADSVDSAKNQPKKDKSDDKAKKADLEARLDYLKALEIKDPGPIIEVIAWHDGKNWRVVAGGAEGDGEENLAPSDDGKAPALLDLRGKKPMTDYHKELHYERFGTQDLLSYSVNIYDEGDIVSLVCVSGTHGTHVAAIIGGRVPESPELNGVAPGVEIVSLKIGDTRLHGLETHQALMRATKAILDTKCDICNMSFGEDSSYSTEDRGQFVTMLRDEVIKKRNVIFVAAAGNAGPALTTIGAPSTTSGIVCVGAFETPSMQISEYAMLENVPAGPYTWSSRGPTYDGANITCFAPGAAVTGVPMYNLQRSQLMNGTSMASPSACGVLSLVLSAMKAEGIPVSSARVHKAIQATVKDVKDPQNIGLIQTEALYQYMVETKDLFDSDADFDIRIISQGHPSPDFSKPLHQREGKRGVYLREPDETSKLHEAACWVKPSFPSTADTEKMYKLDMKLALASTEAWVRTPEFLSLPSSGRNFNIRVDPTSLPPGMHCAQIKAYDTSTHGRLVFTVPVTVCKSEESTAPSHNFKDWHSTPGHIERRFLAVPEGATWAELRLTTRRHDTPVNMWIHCVQLLPLKRLPNVQTQAVLACTAGETVSKKFNVTGGRTLEVCASQFWNSLPTADIAMEIHFHGLAVSQGSELQIVGGSELLKLQVESKVRLEAWTANVSFDGRRTLYRPVESAVTPLGQRDVMPDGNRLYQLVNSYSFKLTEKSKVKAFFPITESLYDSPFGMLMAIFDKQKQVTQFATVYAKEVELEKGEYTLKLQMEHTSFKVLENHKSMALTLEIALGEKLKKLTLDVDRDPIGILSDSKGQAFPNAKIPRGETRPLVVSSELKGDSTDLYKSGKAGDVLLGKLNLGPAGTKAYCNIGYVVPPQIKEADKEGEDKEEPKLIDLQLQIVEKIKDDKDKQAYLDTLLAQNPNHLPLLVASLKGVKEDANPQDIIKASDAVLAEIDENALASYLGRKSPPANEMTDDDKKTKKEMDIKRSAWNLACSRKFQASHKAQAPLTEQNQLFAKYRTFVETPDKDLDFALISAKRDISADRYGSALKTLQKLIDESMTDSKHKEVMELKKQCIKALRWSPLTEYETRWDVFRSPPGEFVW